MRSPSRREEPTIPLEPSLISRRFTLLAAFSAKYADKVTRQVHEP
jgi:hypothetical protein